MERENATLRIGRREIIAMIAGILLYAGSSWITNFSILASGDIAAVIRPGVAVPIFCGFVFGPIVGFVVGFFGNLLFDFSQGYASIPPAGSSFAVIASSLLLNWEVGNGLMGLIPGVAAMFHRRYFTFKEQLRALFYTILAVVTGIGFASMLDPVVFSPAVTGNTSYYSGTLSDLALAFRDGFVPIASTNLINAMIIIPILLFNYERLDLRTGSFHRSGLMRRLLLTITISAAVPIGLLAVFLVQANLSNQASTSTGAVTTVVIVQLAFTILLAAVLVITNAALMAQSVTQPLLRLTNAAQAMEKGELSIKQAAALEDVKGHDEIAFLTRIFGSMASEVIRREDRLRKQVQQLQIIVDERKRDEQVQEIVETDFFQELQTKAKNMRARRELGET